MASGLRSWVATLLLLHPDDGGPDDRAIYHGDYAATEAREAALRAESERIIDRLAHPTCWFCQHETAPGHIHIR